MKHDKIWGQFALASAHSKFRLTCPPWFMSLDLLVSDIAIFVQKRDFKLQLSPWICHSRNWRVNCQHAGFYNVGCRYWPAGSYSVQWDVNSRGDSVPKVEWRSLSDVWSSGACHSGRRQLLSPISHWQQLALAVDLWFPTFFTPCTLFTVCHICSKIVWLKRYIPNNLGRYSRSVKYRITILN